MHNEVRAKYRMFQRRGGVFYWQDTHTGQQGSLGTKDERAAEKLLHAKNEAHEQPILNLALARTYASAHDPKMPSRTWRAVMAEMASHGKAATQERCARAMNSRLLDSIRDKTLLATTSEDLLAVLRTGGNATNHYLRRLHNLAVNLVERRAFYELLWETGCSQSDAAHLRAEDINRRKRVLIYQRMKLGADSQPANLSIGNRLWSLLSQLPSSGKLFPTISKTSAKTRAAEFRQRCKVAGIEHGPGHRWSRG